MPSGMHSRKLAQGGISLPPFPSVGQTGPQAAGKHVRAVSLPACMEMPDVSLSNFIHLHPMFLTSIA